MMLRHSGKRVLSGLVLATTFGCYQGRSNESDTGTGTNAEVSGVSGSNDGLGSTETHASQTTESTTTNDTAPTQTPSTTGTDDDTVSPGSSDSNGASTTGGATDSGADAATEHGSETGIDTVGNEESSADITDTSDTGPHEVCEPGRDCIPEVPDGWHGPVALVMADEPHDLVECGGEFPTPISILDDGIGFDDLRADPAQCVGCASGCDTTGRFDPDDCTTTVKTTIYTPGADCDVDQPSGMPHVRELKATCSELLPVELARTFTFRSQWEHPTIQPFCGEAPEVQVDVPEASWGRYARLCKARLDGADMGCGSEKLCLPRPQPPFSVGMCIARAGALGCPAGEFEVEHTLYAGFTDTRGCSACTCSGEGERICEVLVHAHEEHECQGPSFQLQSGGCKTNLDGDPVPKSGSAEYIVRPLEGYCAPGGGKPTGKALAKDPVKVCCTQ